MVKYNIGKAININPSSKGLMASFRLGRKYFYLGGLSPFKPMPG